MLITIFKILFYKANYSHRHGCNDCCSFTIKADPKTSIPKEKRLRTAWSLMSRQYKEFYEHKSVEIQMLMLDLTMPLKFKSVKNGSEFHIPWRWPPRVARNCNGFQIYRLVFGLVKPSISLNIQRSSIPVDAHVFWTQNLIK